MIHNLSADNSIIQQWIHELRSQFIQEDQMRFRMNLERFGAAVAYEISKQLDYKVNLTATSLGEKETKILIKHPVIVSILRAGIPLQQGILNVFDQSNCGFISTFRKHHSNGTFEITQNHLTCTTLKDEILIIADTMIATGATLLLSLNALMEKGIPKQVHIVSVISCNEGIDKISRKYPQCTIWTGDIDDELTGKGYIVPGLGDAGDLAYGPKK